MLSYPAGFRRNRDGRTLVSFPDFPEAHTDGRGLKEAFEEAVDCLGSAIAFRMAEKNAVPHPSRLRSGQRLVPVPLWVAGKLALYQAIREAGISNSELARRLGVRETIVRRMLDPDHDTKAERLQAALLALGKHLVIAVQDAA